MSAAEIKSKILNLPDSEIASLLEWLQALYGPVWDRQMESDIQRLGQAEFRRRFGLPPS